MVIVCALVLSLAFGIKLSNGNCSNIILNNILPRIYIQQNLIILVYPGIKLRIAHSLDQGLKAVTV